MLCPDTDTARVVRNKSQTIYKVRTRLWLHSGGTVVVPRKPSQTRPETFSSHLEEPFFLVLILRTTQETCDILCISPSAQRR